MKKAFIIELSKLGEEDDPPRPGKRAHFPA